jgi:peptidoglycan/LPS O-acetylase OafA/YrhL
VTSRESKRIPTLDGLRALSIVLVIASHAVDRYQYPAIMHIGPVGVLIFFALSGYLITTKLLDEYQASGSISLRKFYTRRAFRILPPAVVFLAVVWLLSLVGVVICSAAAIRAALFFYTNYSEFGGPGWRVSHFWSLSVEEHFYLFWPFLLLALGVKNGWKTAATAALAICIWRVVDNHYGLISGLFGADLQANMHRTDLTADVLLWGCCLAFLLRRRVALSKAVSTLVAVFAFTAMLVLAAREAAHATPLLHLLPTILLFAVVTAPRAPIGRFLDLPPLKFVGDLSYSLYIWQQLFLGGTAPLLPVPLALVAIFACAFLSQRLVERPCINLGKNLIAARRSWSRGKTAEAPPAS